MSEVVLENKFELPEGWVVCKLEDVAMAINSGFASGVHNKSEKGIPHIRPMNIDSFGNIDLSVVKYVEDNFKDKLQNNDVLFNNTNSLKLLGKTVLIKENTNWGYSNHMTRIRFDVSKVESSWFAIFLHKLFLDGFYHQIANNHVNQSSVNSTTLATKIPIIMAPLNEQKRIVSKIEELFSWIDSVKQSLEHTKLQLEQYRSSLLKSAFEGKLTEKWREENKDTLLEYKKIEGIPKGWIETNIDSIAKIIHYGYTATSTKEDTGIKYLRITDIQNNQVNWNDVPFCKIPKEKRNGFLLNENDIVFARTGGTVGKSYLIKNDVPSVVFASYLIRIILSEHINPKLIYFFFQSADYWQQIQMGHTGLQTNVNAQILSKLVLQIPLHRKEQEQIVLQIEQGFSLIENTTQIVESTLQKLQTMKMSVLKQAFEGKLVPQDPNDEPASVLLQKIKHEKEQLIQKQKASKVKKNVK